MNPERAEIGPYRYTIFRSPVHLDGYNGLLDSNTRTIVVDGTIAEASIQETILHEALHAVIDATGQRSDGDKDAEGEEEKLVAAMSPWLLLFIQKNPALIKYLAKVL